MAQTEQASVHINLDIAESERKVRELEKSLKQLREAKKYATSADDRNKFNEQIKETKASVDALKADLRGKVDLIIDGKAAGASIANMEKAARQLRNTLRNELIPGTKEYNETLKKYLALSKQVAEQSDKLKPQKSFFSKLIDQAGALGVAAAGFLGIQQIFIGLSNSISKAAQLSDAFANVAKTTNLSKSEVQQLNEQLGQINTRSSRLELLGLASDAGKLGIEGVSNIKKFVQEADQIRVALGEDLGEGAVTEIAKVADIFGEGMLNIASSINTVGQSSAATESYQVDFLGRLAGIAKQSGITASEIQGYGAALELNKVQAETASTALGQFFIEFQRDTEKFGKAAGYAKGELSKLIADKGVNKGFIEFLKNLKASSTGTADFLQKLKDIGIDGARGAQTFLALSNNIGLVEKQQAIANKALKEGISITQEFNQRNNTFAGQLERVQKALFGMVSQNGIVDQFAKLVGYIDELASPKLSDAMEEERTSLFSLQLQLNDTNVSTEQRKKIILQLQKEYPSFLGNIDAEKVSNEELNTAIGKINNNLINKIILQRKEEDLIKQANKAADARIKLDEYSVKITKTLQELQKSNPQVKVRLGLSPVENLQNVKAQLDKTTGFFSSDLSDKLSEAGTLIAIYNSAKKQAEEAEGATNKLNQEKAKFIQQLGLETEVNNNAAAASTNATGASQKQNDEEVKLEKDKNEKLIELRRKINELTISIMTDGQAKEQAALKSKYETDRDQIANNLSKEIGERTLQKQQLLLLETQYQQERDAINKRYADKATADSEKEWANEQKEWVEFTKQIDDWIADQSSKEKAAKELGVKIALDITQAMFGAFKTQSTNGKDNKEFLQGIQSLAQQAGGIINSTFQVISNREQTSLQKLNKGMTKEIKNLDAARTANVISEEKYNEQRTQLEIEYDERKRALALKAYKRQKIASIFEATTSMFAGLANALTVKPANLVPAYVAFAGLTGLASIASIATTPPPELAKGARLTPEQLHIIQGPSHTQGGIDLVNTQTGQTIANMEGNEGIYVLSKNTTPQTKAILDHGLASANVPQFALGNYISSFRTADTAGAANAINLARNAYNNNTSTTAINIDQLVSLNKQLITEVSAMRKEQAEMLKENNDKLEQANNQRANAPAPDPFAAYRSFEKVRDRVESVRNTSRI